MGGQIVDATLVAAPKQRNTAVEKEAIKAGKSAAEIWPDQPAKAAQKDTDARWTLKFAKARASTRRGQAARAGSLMRMSSFTDPIFPMSLHVWLFWAISALPWGRAGTP
jgi:hypothetical protein